MTDLPDHDAPPPGMDRLPADLPPPPSLEARVFDALARDGVGGRTASRRTRPWWRDAAAAVVLLALGAGAGMLWARPGVDGRPRYLLLLYPGTAPALDSAAERAAAREYGAWAARLRRDGRRVSGERLADGGEVVPAGAAAPDLALQGYFVISADSADDARRLAEASPHARRGGIVVVRAIDTP
jgi:hypothetical protein